ncbi:MAG: DUF420 domain-containing protein [bacterium]|nr:DUF420 domain-containing protein [bacterium]
MSVSDLPALNAILNGTCTVLLTIGYIQIRKGNQEGHRKIMLSALFTSAAFLISYLIYHYYAGSVPYPHHDWTRPIYFAILIPHVILAALMVPFILLGVWHAFKSRFDRHKRVMRWTWPVWMFVSVTGVLVYLMLYQL